jgi:hypothetical protein
VEPIGADGKNVKRLFLQPDARPPRLRPISTRWGYWACVSRRTNAGETFASQQIKTQIATNPDPQAIPNS